MVRARRLDIRLVYRQGIEMVRISLHCEVILKHRTTFDHLHPALSLSRDFKKQNERIEALENKVESNTYEVTKYSASSRSRSSQSPRQPSNDRSSHFTLREQENYREVVVGNVRRTRNQHPNRCSQESVISSSEVEDEGYESADPPRALASARTYDVSLSAAEQYTAQASTSYSRHAEYQRQSEISSVDDVVTTHRRVATSHASQAQRPKTRNSAPAPLPRKPRPLPRRKGRVVNDQDVRAWYFLSMPEIAYEGLEDAQVGDVLIHWDSESRDIWVMSTSGEWAEAKIGHPYPDQDSQLGGYYLNLIWHMTTKKVKVSWIKEDKSSC
ncbi:hypothetical protein PLICRDRAFT_237651 [Plicaturopsis crispa FD-325 SS-3]|nr:hypothetical protein PLICRDRAFT_237651 [Plicaturopsis crispa FD-325 SS-3]